MVKDILKIKFNMTSTCILFGIHRQCMLYQFDILYQIRLLQIVARAFRPSKVCYGNTQKRVWIWWTVDHRQQNQQCRFAFVMELKYILIAILQYLSTITTYYLPQHNSIFGSHLCSLRFQSPPVRQNLIH